MGMDREKWLAIRNTPRKVGNEKLIHQSTNYVKHKDPKTGVEHMVKGSKGKTFRHTQHKGG